MYYSNIVTVNQHRQIHRPGKYGDKNEHIENEYSFSTNIYFAPSEMTKLSNKIFVQKSRFV